MSWKQISIEEAKKNKFWRKIPCMQLYIVLLIFGAIVNLIFFHALWSNSIDNYDIKYMNFNNISLGEVFSKYLGFGYVLYVSFMAFSLIYLITCLFTKPSKIFRNLIIISIGSVFLPFLGLYKSMLIEIQTSGNATGLVLEVIGTILALFGLPVLILLIVLVLYTQYSQVYRLQYLHQIREV